VPLELVSEISVHAPPEAVWRILVDLDAYAGWNPFIVEASGPVRAGGRLRLRMQPVGGRATTLRPRVVEVAAGRRLRWRGRLGPPGVLDAVHTFTLTPGPGATTRLRQDEVFSGLLLPVVRGALRRGTLPAFHLMDEAVKRRAEHRSAAARG
jgi:hypothetical protein